MKPRDLELLSSYLDGQLSPSDVTRLEARLKTEPQLADVLGDLRATRNLLRKLPKRRAPRNFTLTRKMVGQNPPLPRTYPLFRFASALATLLFFFSFGFNAVGRMASQAPQFVGGYGGGGGGGDGSTELAEPFAAAPAPAATEAPAEAEDLFSTEMLPEGTLVPTPEDTARIEPTPSQKEAGAEENATGPQDPFSVQSEPQAPAPLVSSAWQIGLAALAALSAALMFLTQRLAQRRWK
jgi:hypothetical protein